MSRLLHCRHNYSSLLHHYSCAICIWLRLAASIKRMTRSHLPHSTCAERAQLSKTTNVRTSPHAGEGHKAAKTRIKEAKVSNVAKVVGVSKLKTKYEVRTQWSGGLLRGGA